MQTRWYCRQGGIADKAEADKTKLYSKYDHVESGFDNEGNKVETVKHIVPFAFDARGGIGMEGLEFIRNVFGKKMPGGTS